MFTTISGGLTLNPVVRNLDPQSLSDNVANTAQHEAAARNRDDGVHHGDPLQAKALSLFAHITSAAQFVLCRLAGRGKIDTPLLFYKAS